MTKDICRLYNLPPRPSDDLFEQEVYVRAFLRGILEDMNEGLKIDAERDDVFDIMHQLMDLRLKKVAVNYKSTVKSGLDVIVH